MRCVVPSSETSGKKISHLEVKREQARAAKLCSSQEVRVFTETELNPGGTEVGGLVAKSLRQKVLEKAARSL